MKLVFVILFSFICYFTGISQTLFRMNNVPVYHYQKQIKNPFSGGMHGSIVNQMDLNNDSKLDLVIVQAYQERSNRIQTYINKGNAEYEYSPRYEAFFPKFNQAVFQLVDMNEDGLEDAVYKDNSYFFLFYGSRINDSTLNYTIYDTIDAISYDTFFGTQKLSSMNLYIPIIRDLDGDGDKDLVYFRNGWGKKLHYFKNYKKEKSLPANQNLFYIDNKCWGQHRDTLSPLKFIEGDCNKIIKGERETPHVLTPRHDEFQMVWDLDANNDSIWDVVSYSENQRNAPLGVNYGTKDSAYIRNFDTYFPSNSKPITSLMPNGFWIDIDNDSKRDIISSFLIERDNSGTMIQQKLFNDDINTLWYYRNFGKYAKPSLIDGKVYDSFGFVTDSFLAKETIDVGTSSAPVFVDVDIDSLQDMLIPNVIKRDSWEVSSITYYRNIGSKSQPQYELITKDFLKYKSKNRGNLRVAVGDLNSDGNEDLFITSYDRLAEGSFSNNVNTAISYEIYYLQPNNLIQYDTIHINSENKYGRSNCSFYDVDKDGKLDLFMGDIYEMKFYKNRGTSSRPNFSIIDCDSVINTTADIYKFPYAYKFFPAVWRDPKDNLTYLLFSYEFNGGKVGKALIDSTKLFSNRSLPLINKDIFFNLSINLFPTIAIKDITNDGLSEIAFGNYAGGVQIFSFDSLTGVKDPPPPRVSIQENSSADIHIYPNPIENIVNFDIPYLYLKSSLEIYSLDGKMVHFSDLKQLNNKIDISHFNKGVYILKLRHDKNPEYQSRIIKN